MPTVNLFYGLAGSGKTTEARRLQEDHQALRFTLDEWMIRLYPGAATMTSMANVARWSAPSSGISPPRGCRRASMWRWLELLVGSTPPVGH